MDCFSCLTKTPNFAVVVKSQGDYSFSARLGKFAPLYPFLQDRVIFCGSRYGKMVPVVASNCGSTHASSPLKPRSLAGRFLRDVLQNQPHIFDVAVDEQLEELAADRDGAIARHLHSLGSTESCLHRRIAEQKEHECQIAVEEVMYMLIVHKFLEIQVPMVPRLAKCINNGALGTWPSKDKELESIHAMDVVEMIREHLSIVLGRRDWKFNEGFTDNDPVIQIQRLYLGRVYAASILYGYFLKSACQRHHLDLNLAFTHDQNLPLGGNHGVLGLSLAKFVRPSASKNLVLLGISSSTDMPRSSSSPHHHHHHHHQGLLGRGEGELREYVMGFDAEALQRCSRLKSQESVNLIERHTWSLFANEKDDTSQLMGDEVVDVSLSSLKRLVLEAIAFGSFLWDVEGYVDSIYRLKEK